MAWMPVYHENLAGRFYGLLIGLGDRLRAEQAQLLHHLIDVGEYGLALEEIAGTSPSTRSPSPSRSVPTCSR
jgi:hypothetical protein